VFIREGQAKASPKAPFPKAVLPQTQSQSKTGALHDPAAQAALFNKGAAANRRSSDGSETLSTIVAADRAFPAAFAA
jgi:hypothetical protein